jgi:hypothetical protein
MHMKVWLVIVRTFAVKTGQAGTIAALGGQLRAETGLAMRAS